MPNNLGISDEEFERRFDDEIDFNKILNKPVFKTKEEEATYILEEIKKDICRLERHKDHEENVWRLSRLDKQIENLESLSFALRNDDGGWKKHTDTYWSRDVNGKRLDFWPSTRKFRINGKTYWGLPYKVIEEAKTNERRHLYAEKYKAAEEWERSLINQPEV